MDEIKNWAIAQHERVNQKYGDYPYALHLDWTAAVAKSFFKESLFIYDVDIQMIIDACYLHDVIEDTGVTYNDVKKKCGAILAEIAYALTNEKGRSRAARASDKYYAGIKDTPFADYIKLCDRIANMEFSVKFKGSMLSKYREEREEFIEKLGVENKYPAMVEYLRSL